MNALPATISAKLKAAREAKGWTQADAAARAHISTDQLVHFEAGGGDLPAARLVDLAHALAFELLVVPQDLVRTVVRLDRQSATDSATQLRLLWKSAIRLSSRWPHNAVLTDLVSALAELLNAPLSETVVLRLQALAQSAQQDLDSIRETSDSMDPGSDPANAETWKDLKRIVTGIHAIKAAYDKQKTVPKRPRRVSHRS